MILDPERRNTDNFKLYKEMGKLFPRIEKYFTPEALSEFYETSVHDLGRFNFGIGTLIRLKMLTGKNIIYQEFVKLGCTDRENMSMEILKELHRQSNRL